MKKANFIFSRDVAAIVLLLNALCMYLQPLHAAEAGIFGNWVVPGGDAVVSIVPEGSSARIVLLQLLDIDVLDANNPDSSLRSRPLQGITLGSAFRPFGELWRDGSLYDPETGKRYAASLRIVDENHLEVCGYIGLSLLGRSQTWTRLDYFAPRMHSMLARSEEAAHDH